MLKHRAALISSCDVVQYFNLSFCLANGAPAVLPCRWTSGALPTGDMAQLTGRHPGWTVRGGPHVRRHRGPGHHQPARNHHRLEQVSESDFCMSRVRHIARAHVVSWPLAYALHLTLCRLTLLGGGQAHRGALPQRPGVE